MMKEKKAQDAVSLKYGNTALKISRPCCYCGEESGLECNLCAKIGLATYFCSVQHQSLMWKQHLQFHRNQQAGYQGSFPKGTTHHK